MGRLHQYVADDPLHVMADEHNARYSDELIYRADLHDTSNGRDAVYILLVIRRYDNQAGDIDYMTCSGWGRRGNALQGSTKILPNQMTAVQAAKKTIVQKEAKGYRLVNEEDLATAKLVPKKKPMSRDEAIKRRFEHYAHILQVQIGQTRIPPLQVKEILRSDEWVMEEISDFIGYRYFLLSTGSVFIFKEGSSEVEEEIRAFSYEPSFGGFILLGYKKKNGNFALMDIVHNPNEVGKEGMVWKNRRTLLTTLLGMAIYPNANNLYDTALKFHLSDYIYEEKEYALANPFATRVFNNINAIYSNKLVVE